MNSPRMILKGGKREREKQRNWAIDNIFHREIIISRGPFLRG